MLEVGIKEGVVGASHDPVGGEYRVTASTPMCHVMLGSRGVGLNNTVKEVMTANVLQVGVCVSLLLSMCVSSVHTRGGGCCCQVLQQLVKVSTLSNSPAH